MGQTSFLFSFEGANAAGEMDVADLAPTLLILSDVLLRANEVINGDRASAKIKIKATEQGSFILNLALDVSFIDQVMDLLDAVSDHQERIVAANQLLDLLIKGGKLAAVAAGGVWAVFKVIKWLSGRRPDKVLENEDGTVTLVLGDETATTTKEALKLLGDPAFREHVERLGERIEKLEGIDEVALGDPNMPKAWTLRRDEASKLRLPPPEDEEPEIVVSRRKVWLELVTAHFSEGYKWRFRDGETTFTAEITDTDFLNKVLNGDISLSAADKLYCEVEDEQEISSTEIKKIATRIVRVIEYRPGARQLRLI